MRGKIILSFALALSMLLGMVKISYAPTTTTLSVDPGYIDQIPGTEFNIDINIADVTDLYTYAFDLRFAPFGNTLVVAKVYEGSFLQGIDLDTDFTYVIDVLGGSVKIGNTRLGEVPGVSGSGTLATIKFTIVEAGDSVLQIVDSELYDTSSGSLIPHEVVNGYYDGPRADLVDMGPIVMTKEKRGDSQVIKVGDTATLSNTWITHSGSAAPLLTQVRYDFLRTDGGFMTMWAPSATDYATYVNDYDGLGAGGWTEVGTAPYLDAVGDGNYIVSGDYCGTDGFFYFAPLDMGGADFSNVRFEAYGSAQSTAIDGDIYFFTDFTEWAWIGSIEAESGAGWYFTDAGSLWPWVVYDQASLDSAFFLIHYWTPDGSSGPTMTIDAARLVITVQAPFVVEPGVTVEMEPLLYVMANEDKGKYICLCGATLYYSYFGSLWQAGPTVVPILLYTDLYVYDYLSVTGKPAK